MVDLSAEMADLWGSLGAPAPGRARVVQIVAARRGEGTSTVAREFAFYAAQRAGRSVWLVDLDLGASAQHAALTVDAQRYGPLGEAQAASPDGSMFFTVQPPARTAEGQAWPDAGYLTAHKVGPAKWWVTRFRREAMQPGQTVHVLPQAGYWDALRKFADLIVVDCPSTDRSKAALTVAPFMDQTVLVVAAEQKDVQAPAVLRDSIAQAGGKVAGLFFNRVTVEEPGFLRAFRL
jgi:Mrp family chromosome partitioning ATPase